MGIKLLDNIFKKQSTQTNTTQPTYPDFDIQNGILVKYYGTGGKVIIPTEVNAIGKNAFSGCNTLTDVEIPNTVTSIGESAFYNCMALKSITIPSSIKSIGDWAFTGCLNLKAVCNLSTLKISVGAESFGAVAKYAEVVTNEPFKQTNKKTRKTTKTAVVVKDVIDLYDFDIKEGVLVKYIGNGGNVVIPSNVKTIGEEAFFDCASITNVTIPNSVKKIEFCAFDLCTGIKEITIPSSVEEIAGSVFSRCSNLTTINVSANNKKYKSIDGNLYKKRSDDGLELIQYAVGKKDTTFSIPSEVVSIETYAFWGNTSLKNIITNDKTGWFSTIDGNLYYDYGKRLLQYACGKTDTEFTIPEGVEEILNSGCSYCKHLKKVNLPSTLTKIGYNSLSCMENLQEIVIPASVTEIGEIAFWGCENLKTVYNLSKLDIQKSAEAHGYVGYYAENLYSEPPKAQRTPIDNIQSTNLDFDIQNGVLVKYIGNGGNVVIPNSVTSIGGSAFFCCKSLTSITIPNSVTSIGESAFSNCTSLTSITIPSAVTSIGNSAFFYCSFLKSITIPNSVTSIGNEAFAHCTSLQSITIPDSVTSIGWRAFEDCASLKSITIPSSVTDIDLSAFYGCKNLKTVYNLSKLDIQKGAVTHGCVAYYADNVYTELPKAQPTPIDNIPSINPDFDIQNGVLVKYNGKEEVVFIPESINTIGKNAFANCNNLIDVIIPKSVKAIQEFAFFNCLAIRQISIHAKISSIDSKAFIGCYNLESLEVDSLNPYYEDIDGNLYSKAGQSLNCRTLIQYAVGKPDSSFTTPSDCNVILPYAFYGNKYLKSIIVSNPGTYLSKDGNLYSNGGKKLLQYAPGKLDSEFTLPKTVTEIGECAFAFNNHIKVVHLGEKVVKIGRNAFRYCEKLQEITIPKSMESIEVYAFQGCKNLKTVYNLSKLKIQEGSNAHGYVGSNAIIVVNSQDSEEVNAKTNKNKTTKATKKAVEKTQETPVNSDFVINADGIIVEYKGSAKEVVIPDYVVGIGQNAFANNESITSLVCGENLGLICDSAFNNCPNLKSVVCGKNLKYIDDYAFNKCSNLAEVEFGEMVREIGKYAFARCAKITSIILPTSIMEIKIGAFQGCSALNDVKNRSALTIVEKQTANGYVGYNTDIVYQENEYLEKIALKDGVVVGYEGGKDYRVIALPSTTKSIGSEAFADNYTLEEIHTPDSLVEIGYRAFENCSKLRKVVLGSELERIAMRAFTKCASLEAIELPNTLTTIASWSFDDCTSLKEIVIPASVTVIEDGTFYGCTSLEKVTFLGEIQSVGAYAFDGCVALKEINLPKKCNIDDTAFNNCTKIKK